MVIVVLSVLVFEKMKRTFGDGLYRGLYLVNEVFAAVRELCLLVAEPETVPQAYELQRLANFQLSSLRLSAAKEALMFRTFESHRVYYPCGGEYQHAVTVVEEFFMTVALNLLQMPQVSDQINMALSCWSPEVLMYGRVSELEETVGYLVEALECSGRVLYAEKTAMIDSFVRFVGQFRDDHVAEYDLSGHEHELWQYGATNVSLRRLMQFVFCLSGGVSQSWNLDNFGLPSLSSESLSSMFRTVLSWCTSRGVMSLQSIPDGLVAECVAALGRVNDLRTITLGELWKEVGGVAADGYRDSVMERMSFTVEGGRVESPEIGGEHRI